MLADLIRHHPDPHQPAAGGILTPSVRTPAGAGYSPRQHVFFVPHNTLAIPGTRRRRWDLTIEFADVSGQSVTALTQDVDWARPWFRLSGGRSAVPAFGPRPQSQSFAPGVWYQIEIRFA
jgi:hypothetical protein